MQDEAESNQESYKTTELNELSELKAELAYKTLEELERGSYDVYAETEQYGMMMRRSSNKQLIQSKTTGAWFEALKVKYMANRIDKKRGWQKYIQGEFSEKFNNNNKICIRSVSNYILIANNWEFLYDRGLTSKTYSTALKAITMFKKGSEDVSEVGKCEIATETAKVKSVSFAHDHEVLRKDIQVKEKKIKELESKCKQYDWENKVFEQRLKQAGLSTEVPKSVLGEKLNVHLTKESLNAKIDAELQKMIIPAYCTVRSIDVEDLTDEMIEEIIQKDRNLSETIDLNNAKYSFDIEKELDVNDVDNKEKLESVKAVVKEEPVPLHILALGTEIMSKKIRRNNRPKSYEQALNIQTNQLMSADNCEVS